ncbi:DinB family protein [Myxococcota bacterium]|nr:DinB family protein [Myxococcota bacterium]
MSDAAYARRMARYNRWQNDNLLQAAGCLSAEERRRDRGAFFGSIEATFAHLLWADRMWMSRFAPDLVERPASRPERGATVEWERFVAERRACDETILSWADALTEDAFAEPLTWFSGIQGRQVSRSRAFVVTHFFNHQTHHRGQVHALLTAAGVTPGDTDLMLMPEEGR